MDEVLFFDGSLSQSQITDIYENQVANVNYDGIPRICNTCEDDSFKDGTFNAVDLVSGACNAQTHWNNNIQTKLVNDNLNLSILAKELETDPTVPLEANITKISLVYYPSGDTTSCSGSSTALVELCTNCGVTNENGCLDLSFSKIINQRASECVEVLIEGKDKEDSTNISISENNASDNFSIRPDTYSCDGITASTLVSQAIYSSSFKATPLNLTTASLGYTSSFITVSSNKYMRNGDLNISMNGSLSLSGLNFIDGSATDINLSFSDVGDIGIDLKDSAWANVDADDTPESNRIIHAECKRLFIPDHFLVSLDRPVLENNANTGFSYLSNLSASVLMSAWMKNLSFTLTAQGKNNDTLLNYTSPSSLLYANDVKLIPLVTFPIKHSAATKYLDLVEQDTSDIGLLFTNGVATYKYADLGFNYERDFSNPINPFSVEGDESLFSLSVQDNLYPSVIGDESTSSDNNVSFYYGRLLPSDIITTTLASNTTALYEVYDSTGSSFTQDMKQRSLFWFINHKHDDANEGYIIEAVASSSSLINDSLSEFSFSYNPVSSGYENLSINTASRAKATIHLKTQEWLWYVPSNFGSAYADTAGTDCTMHPCLKFSLVQKNIGLKVESGDFSGTVVPDENRSDYIQRGVKLFR